MGKGSGGARAATAPKAGNTKESAKNYNSVTGEGLAEKVTEENRDRLQQLANKDGSKVISKLSGNEIDNDDKTYKVKTGDIVVPSSDKRPAIEIRTDRRPESDFAPVNKNAKESPYSGPDGARQRKNIESARKEFNTVYKRMKETAERARDREEDGAKPIAKRLREQVKEDRSVLLKLGKKIVDTERKNGVPISKDSLYFSLFSSYLS